MTDEAEKPEVASDPGVVDIKLVETLAEIVARLGLSEIEIKHGEMKIRIAGQSTGLLAQVPVVHAAPAPVAVPVLPAPPHHQPEHPGTVKSPMVGTAYLRPSPTAAAFVEIGTQVKSGDKILLVEAMKTFNEIIAPRAGTVTDILVEDGQPVEYGQPLLVIE